MAGIKEEKKIYLVGIYQCFFIETEVYERLVFQYAQHLYHYKKEKDCKAIIEMRKCIGAMKLAGSNHLAKTYEGYLEKILENKI